MTNLGNQLRASAEHNFNRLALRCADQALTYGEFFAAASATAGLLRARQIKAGDRIGIVLGNISAFPITFYGALMAGCTVVPMNPLLSTREIQFYLTDSGASALFAPEGSAAITTARASGVETITLDVHGLINLPPTARPIPEPVARASTDTAVLLYTSGTTGTPKGAELTHANLLSNARTCATMFALKPADVVMGCLPLFHVFGLTCALNATVIAGASLSLLPRFDAAAALSIIDRDSVSVFIGVPTMYSALLQVADHSSYDSSTLRLCASGGSAMPVEVLKRVEKAFGCIILEGYGLSETSPVASFNHADAKRKPGSIGTPVAGMEMRLIDDDGNDVRGNDVGEIAIRGEGLMKGYWRRPEATKEAIIDGWFRTGDLARRDADGYFFIVDRKKDLIIRGGYNVYPREVEEILYQHHAVAEAAVIGIKHAELGEEIGAAVKLKPGASAALEELREFVKQRIAAYKYPRHVWLVCELPKGPTGKILRREVKIPEHHDRK